MKLLFILLFVVGALLAGTANLQLTAGVVLMLIGYAEFRKTGLTLENLDDALLEKLKDAISKL